MITDLPFETHEGAVARGDLKLFALSTCGFCKRAIKFLKDRDVTFSFIYLDSLGVERKREVSASFREEFGARMLYPTLLIDGRDFLTGFVQPSWEDTLSLAESS